MEKVIFDTNAYRYLVTDKGFNDIDRIIEKVKEKERQRGIKALTSPIVVKELLAHVADRNDPSFQKCHNAIKALYLHSGDSKSYNLLASPELLIAKSFFNQTIPSKVATNEALMQIAFHLATNPTPYIFTKFQRNLNLIRDYVLDAEHYFAQSLKQFVNAVDPSSTGWQIHANNEAKRKKALRDIRSVKTSISLAGGLICTVGQELINAGKHITLSEEELTNMSNTFIKIFPEYIALYKSVFENLVNSNFNMFQNSRTNFLWDIHLMLNVGNHTIDGERLYFVTDDKAIIRNAIEENARYTILSYQEYIDYIN